MSSTPIKTLKEQVDFDENFVMKIESTRILFRRPVGEILVYRCKECSNCFETEDEEAQVRI